MAHFKRHTMRRKRGKWYSCGCCEVITKNKFPVEDGPCTGKTKRKKPRTKKEKCPVNRTHEWYKEEVVEVLDYTWAWHPHKTKKTIKRLTCIHCWKVKEKVVNYQYIRV